MAVKKPKFKVGDPIVFMHEGQAVYMLVYNMSYQQKIMKAIRRVGRLIKTESGIGLTSEHADQIISLLNH